MKKKEKPSLPRNMVAAQLRRLGHAVHNVSHKQKRKDIKQLLRSKPVEYFCKTPYKSISL